MNKQDALEKIEEYRAEIDAVDREIVEFLNKRAGLAIAIRRLKPLAGTELFDPSREDAIYEKICNVNADTSSDVSLGALNDVGPGLSSDANSGILCDVGLREIYATILKVMKENPDRETDN